EGKILAGFNVDDPQIISGKKMEASAPAKKTDDKNIETEALHLFVDAIKSGKQYPGNFSEAEFITEAVNLYALALRTNRMLKYDAANVKVTNVPEANKYISRDYRKGWDPESI
ncbi:MAG: gfo/Idh/MocA family oxidoreductase, partial [Ilyomonas sp.]